VHVVIVGCGRVGSALARSLTEAGEGLPTAVDDRHGVPHVEQGEAQRRTDATASDDDDVHRLSIGNRRSTGPLF